MVDINVGGRLNLGTVKRGRSVNVASRCGGLRNDQVTATRLFTEGIETSFNFSPAVFKF